MSHGYKSLFEDEIAHVYRCAFIWPASHPFQRTFILGTHDGCGAANSAASGVGTHVSWYCVLLFCRRILVGSPIHNPHFGTQANDVDGHCHCVLPVLWQIFPAAEFPYSSQIELAKKSLMGFMIARSISSGPADLMTYIFSKFRGNIICFLQVICFVVEMEGPTLYQSSHRTLWTLLEKSLYMLALPLSSTAKEYKSVVNGSTPSRFTSICIGEWWTQRLLERSEYSKSN